MKSRGNTDLALLIHQAAIDPHLSLKELDQLCEASKHFNFSGFCTNLKRLPEARKRLNKSSRTKLIGLIAFPFGFTTSSQKHSEAEWAADEGADELEAVPDFLALSDNKPDQFAEELAKICEIGLPVRVILDTSQMNPDKIDIAIDIAIDAGVSGIQAGNGFGNGVSADDIYQISKKSRERCEIKAVGGIKTLDQVIKLNQAGADRIGTSLGIEIMEELRARKN